MAVEISENAIPLGSQASQDRRGSKNRSTLIPADYREGSNKYWLIPRMKAQHGMKTGGAVMKPIISDISAIAQQVEARFHRPISRCKTVSYEQLSMAHLALNLRNARKRSSVIKYLPLETWEILFALFAAYKQNQIVQISGFKNELSRVSAHSLCYDSMLVKDGLFYLDRSSSDIEHRRVALTPKGVEYLTEVLKRSEIAHLLDADNHHLSAMYNLPA